MKNRRPSRKILEAARTIVDMVDSGKFVNVVWTWEYIGQVTGLSVGQAHEVIYYLRNNHDDVFWTVGTYGTPTQPTSSIVVALPGLVNQYRHSYTRERSHERAWTVLSKVDPDPKWARFAEREARWWKRKADDTRDHLEALVDEV